jgi:hypothetical protein
MEIKDVPDKLKGADPAYNRLIANINTELKNHKRSAVHGCFAIYAGYLIVFQKTDFSHELLDAAAAFEISPDIGMLYANIEPLKAENAEFLQQRVTTQAATCKETLRLAKYFFDRLVKPRSTPARKKPFGTVAWSAPRRKSIYTATPIPSSAPSSRTYSLVSTPSSP